MLEQKKIRCEKCNKVICKGSLPAPVEIKCSGCDHLNDLSQVPNEKPVAIGNKADRD